MNGYLGALILFAAGLALPGSAVTSATPVSVDCARTGTGNVRLACSDPGLVEQDRLMAKLYPLAQTSAFGTGPSSQAAVQREWIEWARSSDVFSAENLRLTYIERNRALATAILFSHPDVALPALRVLDPEAAPLLEAIYLYARRRGAPIGADRARIAGLLKPYADQKNGAWGTVDSALKNDRGFAEFVGVRSAYLSGGSVPLPFPCAAVVEKPRLIDATGPRFGSNMDNFVTRSDCEATLPPLPRFTALVRLRGKGLTYCGGGSIRFAYYSAFANAAMAARLATGAQYHSGKARPMPRRRGVSSVDIASAESELAAYYVRYRRASARQALPLARQMIFTMLEQAWQC